MKKVTKENVKSFLKEHKTEILLGCGGVVLTVVGIKHICKPDTNDPVVFDKNDEMYRYVKGFWDKVSDHLNKADGYILLEGDEIHTLDLATETIKDENGNIGKVTGLIAFGKF